MKRAFFFILFIVCYWPCSLFCISKEEITPSLLNTLFSPYYKDDPSLKEYIEKFPFENYDIYAVENRDLYYVDAIPDIIKSQFIRRGVFYEVHVFEQLWRYTKPGTIAIDAGGHIGTHTLSLARFVEKGIVHVFEPQLKLFVELVINMHLNHIKNVVFHRVALGSEQKVVEMHPHNPSNEGGTSVGLGGDIVGMEKIDSYNLHNVSIMKIDVEGHEMQVIEGARNTILNNKPVLVVEIMGGTSYEFASSETKKEIHARMKKIEDLGYSIYPIGMHDYLCLPKGRKDLRAR